jgi:hypothetical protein
MKYILALFASLALLAAGASAFGERPDENASVRCEVSMKQKSLKAGATGQILVSLQPKKGIHINLDQPIQIKMDSAEVIASVGKPEIPVIDTSYDASKPIRLRVTISKNAKPGKFSLRGTVIYFYCSDTEGWCSRFKQPIDVQCTVTK